MKKYFIPGKPHGKDGVPLFYVQDANRSQGVFCTGKEWRGALKKKFNVGECLGYAWVKGTGSRVPLFRAYNPMKDDYFCTTYVPDIDKKGPIIHKKTLDKVLRKQLGKFYVKGLKEVWYADNWYFCTTKSVAKEIIRESKISGQFYIYRSHDCDDFAILLKSAFINDIYYKRNRSMPYACGILWGVGREDTSSQRGSKGPAGQSFDHALNFIVVSEGRNDDFAVYIIEPMSGKWYEPKDAMMRRIRLVVC
jgi:hypothetical protein